MARGCGVVRDGPGLVAGAADAVVAGGVVVAHVADNGVAAELQDDAESAGGEGRRSFSNSLRQMNASISLPAQSESGSLGPSAAASG